MVRGTHKVFHFPVDDGVVDIDAASYSEARRRFKELRGHFPEIEPEEEDV